MTTQAVGPGNFLVFTFIATFGLSCVFAVGGTFMVRRVAHRFGLVDMPDGDRRLHSAPVPRVGGIAVYIAVSGVLLLGLLTVPDVSALLDHKRVFFALILGATAIFTLGLLDDVFGLSARMKFLGEVLVAGAMYYNGLRFEGIGWLGGESIVFAPWLSLVLTTLWIVGITNAFNLIDGSDGVAAGAALFAATSIAAVSLLGGHTLGAIAALAVAGGTLGFLVFNFPPATVFLGDSGALFLGFTLATLGIVTTQAASTTLAVAIPVVSFGLPILDTLLAITRRFLRGEAIYNPDRGHIHHRLRDLGHSPRRIALLLYLVSAGFAMLSMMLVHPNGAITATIFVVAGAIVLLGVQRLNIPELLELRRILHRGFHQRNVIANNVRLREAVTKLQQSHGAEDITRALGHAFSSGEFVRAELHMPADFAAPFVAAGLVSKRGGNFIWYWESSVSRLTKLNWEMRLPVRVASWQDAAYLSIWICGSTDFLLTDLRLLASDLGPSLEAALASLHGPRQLQPVVSDQPVLEPRGIIA